MIDGKLMHAKDAPQGVRLFSAREIAWGSLADELPRGRAFHFEGARPRSVSTFPADVFFVPSDPLASLGAEPFAWTSEPFRQAGRDQGRGVRIKWPPDLELLDMARKKGFRVLGVDLGTSDAALRARVRKVEQRLALHAEVGTGLSR